MRRIAASKRPMPRATPKGIDLCVAYDNKPSYWHAQAAIERAGQCSHWLTFRGGLQGAVGESRKKPRNAGAALTG
jgi:hypothetical protein